MVEVSVPMEAATMPPNAHPWIRWVAVPRNISAVLSVFHLGVIAAGLAAISIPDDHPYNHALHSASADSWGAMLVIGGALGFVGALPGWWWLERIGLYLEVIGLALYVAALWLLTAEPAQVLAFRTAMAGSLILASVNRYLRIAGAGLDPRRGPTSRHG